MYYIDAIFKNDNGHWNVQYCVNGEKAYQVVDVNFAFALIIQLKMVKALGKDIFLKQI